MARENVEACIICTNIDCAARGSTALIEALQEKLPSAGLSDVKVRTYQCFGGCEYGPNMMLYPEGSWFAGAQASDADDIVEFIQGGEIPARLVERVDPDLRALMLDLFQSGIIDI
jgi:NADP-reducing hydrogenase subunit HndC